MIYDETDLQRLDDRCIELASEFGLEPPKTLFSLVPAEDMYDIAARGLPGRYSHYQFGKRYEQEKRAYDTGKGRIYELVINTSPVQAYLLEGNSLVAQLLVIAHVYGHGVMFEHNAYFKPADKNILSRVRSAADRIDRYIAEYGRTEVENFIDACEALQHNASIDQLGKKPTAKEPKFETKPYDNLFPKETDQRRNEYRMEKEIYRRAFPKRPERDVLRFIERYSPRLEDWQKDIISIICTEREYFAPQGRTQVLNEGVASYYHQNIVQQIMVEDPLFAENSDAFTEFQAMNAGVMHPKITRNQDGLIECVGYNPYLLGYTILTEIERICTDPTEDEKERWAWAGNADPQEKRNQIIRSYDDTALLSEFITQSVCERAKLFMKPRTDEAYKKLHLTEKEAEEVRVTLTKMVMTRNMPVVEIVNGDGRARGELWLEHRIDPDHEVGLDEEYALGTITHMATLWGRGCVVHSIDSDKKDCWYFASPTATAKKYKSMQNAGSEA